MQLGLWHTVTKMFFRKALAFTQYEFFRRANGNPQARDNQNIRAINVNNFN